MYPYWLWGKMLAESLSLYILFFLPVPNIVIAQVQLWVPESLNFNKYVQLFTQTAHSK